jgi:hypothetical protein
MAVSPGTVERSPVIPPETKTHKGALPSPIAGMSMGDWLSHARMVEHDLEIILKRENLTHSQRAKYGELLFKVRSSLVQQLDRLNEPGGMPKKG